MDIDIRKMSKGIMREQLWQKPPATIELYTIKKHLQNIPEFKNTKVTKLHKTEVDNLKES